MDNKITLEHIEHAKSPTGDEGFKTLDRMNNSHDELTNWALSFLPEMFPGKCLDIGCGGGATIKRLINKFPDSFVNGIDYSETSVEASKKFNQELLGLKCDVCWGDVTKLQFPKNHFNLITAFETVYFWKDIDTAFTNVYETLENNGVFLICCEMSNPNNPRWENVLDEMHILSIDGWSKLLIKNNFSIISTHTNKVNDEWICLIVSKNV